VVIGKKTLSVLVVVALLAACAYSMREWLMLEALGLANRMRNSVSANRPVAWQQGPATAELSADKRPPNVVVILVDDMGFNDITLHGGGVAGGTVPTPHIDSVARDGADLVNGYAGNAVCAPSRAAIMTSRYSTRFGFEFTPMPAAMTSITRVLSHHDQRLHDIVIDDEAASDRIPMDEMGMPPSEVTLAEALGDRGYHTMHLGKWHLGRSPRFRPSAQGFDESIMMESGLYLPEDSPEVVNSKQDFDVIDRILWAILQYAVSFNDSDWFEPEGYLTDYLADQAVAAIGANRNRPFLLYLAHWGVHTPLQATRADYDALDHIEDHRLRVYAGMVRSVDRSVGRVLAALREHGLEENTLVVFTSDNGGAGYIGLPEVNKPYRGWKLTLFEGGTHVPFFIKWPARVKPGLVYHEPVSHVDIMATAVAAAGGGNWTENKVDGVDLVPFITGQVQGSPHQAVFWRQGYYQSVLSGGWKLQVSSRPAKRWLYNMADDPTEQKNLAGAHPEKVAELEGLLARHDAEQAQPLWPLLVEFPVAVDKTGADTMEEDDEYVYWPN
jgi:uncharacterized sulfatase